MTRPRVQQLHQSGATDGQTIRWDDATSVWIVADPAAFTTCRADFTAAGGEAVVYLNATPASNSEAVYVDGLRLSWATEYTVSGSTITLATALTVGQVLLVEYETEGTCGIAALSARPTGFNRPVSVTRPVRRFHRIR